ncbi:hypothetical protein HNP12_000860 [Aeromonas hydrophila]|uniref:hypothetical protein n=1 Tax=Aeromonas hydrophila TaxID=644 RepID=UPI00216848AC|nr:hypothetical protein [Aeromonas hydrophila]MCS3766812.1 hypothetical protein [Aeromonas hydrophila]MCS3792960.1 hypothetical protein [Aeromonas hydrophila]
MSTLTSNYLQDLLSDVYSRAKLARDTLLVANDAYRILCAIQMYGEQQVCITLANIIMRQMGLNFLEANTRASFFISYVLNTAAGNGYGKEVIEELKK